MNNNPYSSVRDLLRVGPMPEWYRMKTDGSYIEIWVDAVFWPYIIDMYKNHITNVVAQVATKFPTYTFVNTDEHFGFNGYCTVTESDGWRKFHAPLSVVRHVNSDQRSDSSMSLSLKLLLRMLEMINSQSQQSRNQLYGVTCAGRGGIYLECGIAAYVTLELAQYIDAEKTIPEFVTEIMTRAYHIMHQGKHRDLYLHQMEAKMYNEFPGFVVPGSCACLSVSYRQKDNPVAFMMHPHNVDDTVQTITMLVAVTSYFEYLREKYQK